MFTFSNSNRQSTVDLPTCPPAYDIILRNATSLVRTVRLTHAHISSPSPFYYPPPNHTCMYDRAKVYALSHSLIPSRTPVHTLAHTVEEPPHSSTKNSLPITHHSLPHTHYLTTTHSLTLTLKYSTIPEQ